MFYPKKQIVSYNKLREFFLIIDLIFLLFFVNRGYFKFPLLQMCSRISEFSQFVCKFFFFCFFFALSVHAP